ncbi:MAG: glycosyltransferase family 39 protein [Candidatus Omnitrophica bacterium]|nr:glycosyltransferase family 39 protein [Candidatus Omnitrophota bacterium]
MSKLLCGFLLVCICAIGFLLRIYHLTVPSLWFDELMTAGRINYSLVQTIQNLFVSPFPPLYYIFMNLWVKIFSLSEFSLRFPSVVFSTLTIPLVYLLAKEIFDKRTALISALLVSISPFSINYAQDAKMYSMLWFFEGLSFYYFLKFVKTTATRSLVAYVIFSILSLYTLYAGFIFLITQNLIFFMLFYRTRRKAWLVGQLAIALAFVFWLPVFFYNAGVKTGFAWIAPIKDYGLVLKETFAYVTGIAIGGGRYLRLELLLFAFLILFGFIMSQKTKRVTDKVLWFGANKTIALFILWICLPVIILIVLQYCGVPLFVIRYVGFIYIPLLILIARGLCGMTARYVLLALAGIMYLTVSLHLIPYYTYGLKINVEDWRGICAQLRSVIKNNDAVYYSGVGHLQLEYFVQGLKVYLPGKQIPAFDDEAKKRIVRERKDAFFIIFAYHDPGLRQLPGYVFKKNVSRRSIDRYDVTTSSSERTIGFAWFQRTM